jgi:hypothetical protein
MMTFQFPIISQQTVTTAPYHIAMIYKLQTRAITRRGAELFHDMMAQNELMQDESAQR